MKFLYKTIFIFFALFLVPNFVDAGDAPECCVYENNWNNKIGFCSLPFYSVCPKKTNVLVNCRTEESSGFGDTGSMTVCDRIKPDGKKVPCDIDKKCMDALNYSDVKMTLHCGDCTGGDTTPELTIGDTKELSVYFRPNDSNISNVELMCSNCDSMEYLKPDGGSWHIINSGKNEAEIKFKFDTNLYLKKENPKFPTQIKLKFYSVFDRERTVMGTQSKERGGSYGIFILTITSPDCKSFNKKDCVAKGKNVCLWIKGLDCVDKFNQDKDVCKKIKQQDDCKKMEYCEWNDGPKTCVQKGDRGANIDKYLEGKYSVPDDYEGPLPDCAFSGTCRNTNDLLELLINIGHFIFSLVAGIAFAFFIYGGFLMIFSFGNAEHVKKGQQVLVAAVVGLIIVFSAYIMVNFLLDTLGVASSFRGI